MIMLWLLGMTVFELVKRIISPLFYPFAYLDRHNVREKLGAPKSKWDFLWYVLDDTVVIDSLNRVKKPLEYCVKLDPKAPKGYVPNKTEPLRGLACTEFLRAFNWGSLRNNCINLRDALALGPMIEEVSRKQWAKGFYAVRRFPKGTRPYFEYWVTEHFRVQCGWLTSGWFQVQANKK
jgi:hypothetical protein